MTRACGPQTDLHQSLYCNLRNCCHCIAWSCIELRCFALRCVALLYVALCCIALRCIIALHCIGLRPIRSKCAC